MRPKPPARWTFAAVVAVVATSLAACGGQPDAQVTLFDYGILAPTTLEAGDRTFEVTVEGVAHHTLTMCRSTQTGQCDGDPIPFTWVRLPEDARDPSVIPERTSAIVLGAGWNAEVATTLEPGTYRVWCSIVNHSAYGMDRLLDVTAAP